MHGSSRSPPVALGFIAGRWPRGPAHWTVEQVSSARVSPGANPLSGGRMCPRLVASAHREAGAGLVGQVLANTGALAWEQMEARTSPAPLPLQVWPRGCDHGGTSTQQTRSGGRCAGRGGEMCSEKFSLVWVRRGLGQTRGGPADRITKRGAGATLQQVGTVATGDGTGGQKERRRRE